jgi:hypothetical protein
MDAVLSQRNTMLLNGNNVFQLYAKYREEIYEFEGILQYNGECY